MATNENETNKNQLVIKEKKKITYTQKSIYIIKIILLIKSELIFSLK